MRCWCVRVPREEGESIRKKLLENGLLEISLRIRGEGDHLLLPVNDPGPLEDMELLIEDFEERKVLDSDYRKLIDLPDELMELLPASFDVVGDIAVLRLQPELLPVAKEVGDSLRKAIPRLRTVVLDHGLQGEHRVRDLEVLSGSPSTQTIHTEYGLRFKVDLSLVYFNPRLAVERRRISSLVRDGEVVIDMFAGVGPFSIMIARYACPSQVYAMDINPHAIDLMRENIRINKVEGVEPMLGDARSLLENVPKASRVIMNLPHSALQFLEDAALHLETGGVIHLYAISERERVDGLVSSAASSLARRGIALELSRMAELKTYSPTMSVYSFDMVLNRSSSAVQG